MLDRFWDTDLKPCESNTLSVSAKSVELRIFLAFSVKRIYDGLVSKSVANGHFFIMWAMAGMIIDFTFAPVSQSEPMMSPGVDHWRISLTIWNSKETTKLDCLAER